jgi:hypothetical protein
MKLISSNTSDVSMKYGSALMFYENKFRTFTAGHVTPGPMRRVEVATNKL